MRWFSWAVGAVAIVVVVVVYFHGGKTLGNGPSALTGLAAPSYALTTMTGAQSELSAYRGRVVVMNLWASWCPPCREEMPELQRLFRSYGSRGVTVLGIDEGESASRAASFAQSMQVHYPILLDRQQQYGRVYSALGLPTTIVIDQTGIIARGFDGPLTYAQMVQAVRPLLAAHS